MPSEPRTDGPRVDWSTSIEARGVISGLGRSSFPELDTPVALVDLDIAERNISRMAERATGAGVRLRPHAKTHKTTALARLQQAYGCSGFTVAKLGEAEVLVEAGFDDLLVVVPVVGPAKLERLRVVASRARISIAVDSVEAASGIGSVGSAVGHPISIYLEVDCGHHRCGAPPGEPSADLARLIAKIDGVQLVGLMTHAGHAYAAADDEMLRRIALEEAQALVETAEILHRRGWPVRELSIGSTPTAKHLGEVARAYPAITETRPGTYVFNDSNQLLLGTAQPPDCALGVLSTVVARPEPGRVLIDAGSKVLGSDRNAEGYGRIAGHDGVIERLSEEHGIVSVPRAAPWRVGDRLTVIPSHACLVPNLTDELIGVRGASMIGPIPVSARGRSR